MEAMFFFEVLKKGASERKKLDVHHVGDGLRFTEMNLLLDENRPPSRRSNESTRRSPRRSAALLFAYFLLGSKRK
jgi:hypothetical protein